MPEPASPPASPQYVPYQAYKPKRHSRNISNASAAGSRPSSVVLSPAASPSPRTAYLDEDRDAVPALSIAGSYGTPSSPSFMGQFMQARSESRPQTPAIRVEAVEPTTPISSSPNPLPEDASTTSEPSRSEEDQKMSPSKPQTPSPFAFPQAQLASQPPSPSSPSPSSNARLPTPLSPGTRKVSTFRRLTPRPSAPSSPLAGPNRQVASPSTHTRSVSTASLPPQTTPRTQHEGLPPLAMPAISTYDSRSQTPSAPISAALVSPRTVDKTLPLTPKTPPVSATLELRPSSSQSSTFPSQIAKSTSQGSTTGAPSPIDSRPPSATAVSRPKAASAPYRPGFQPKGVYRPLTDEFLAMRRSKHDGESDADRLKRIEKTKLERRFEKLVALHFPPPESEQEKKNHLREKPEAPKPISRRASSFFDLDSLKSKKVPDASDLWRGVVLGNQDKARDIRAAEQRITPWEEDNAVSKCPLCQASFHPLTCRKHHCRLCGKIICALPPKMPQRPVTCSLLFIVDAKTQQVEEVGEGVDYGIRRKNPHTRQQEDDKFLRGVRICRDCRPIILRQQYLRQSDVLPTFHKIYNILIALEQEIEDALPQFQELLVTLNHNDQPSKEAMAARRRLLEAFGQYDKLSKQIRTLPCPGGPGSSQDRVQAAILTRAGLFLQKNMFPLQFVPKPSASKIKEPNGTPENNTNVDIIDKDSELARTLQPLLEQETLLESFIEEAKAQRKFEDVKTLKMNHAEIQKEINRILSSAGI